MVGDSNANLAKEEIHQPTMGNHSKHLKANDNGRKLIEFATEKDVKITKKYL